MERSAIALKSELPDGYGWTGVYDHLHLRRSDVWITYEKAAARQDRGIGFGWVMEAVDVLPEFGWIGVKGFLQ